MSGEGAGAALRQVVGSSRPFSWINTAYPFAAAYLLGGGRVDVTFVLGTVFFLVPYNLAMYGINDVFDHESDLRNPRKGGLEGVVLSTRWHRLTLWSAALSCAPFLVYLLAVGSWAARAALVVSMFAVVAYSARGLRFKERPVLDSLTSSTHFVSPAVVALALVDAEVTTVTVCALVAFFVWGAASQAFGAVQDITADRDAGIASIATHLGARRTVRAALVAYVVAAVVLVGTGWPGVLAAVPALAYAASVAPFWNLTDARCEEANRGWRRFLWLNLLTGFWLTQLFIWVALTR